MVVIVVIGDDEVSFVNAGTCPSDTLGRIDVQCNIFNRAPKCQTSPMGRKPPV